jgi:hypothetical protein
MRRRLPAAGAAEQSAIVQELVATIEIEAERDASGRP